VCTFVEEVVEFFILLLLFSMPPDRLVGDVVLATGFLSYCGPYNQEFRSGLIRSWMNNLKSREIPFTYNLNISNMLVDSGMVGR
jgi:dynein heavy chain